MAMMSYVCLHDLSAIDFYISDEVGFAANALYG